jgi:hypothetical protein
MRKARSLKADMNIYYPECGRKRFNTVRRKGCDLIHMLANSAEKAIVFIFLLFIIPAFLQAPQPLCLAGNSTRNPLPGQMDLHDGLSIGAS